MPPKRKGAAADTPTGTAGTPGSRPRGRPRGSGKKPPAVYATTTGSPEHGPQSAKKAKFGDSQDDLAGDDDDAYTATPIVKPATLARPNVAAQRAFTQPAIGTQHRNQPLNPSAPSFTPMGTGMGMGMGNQAPRQPMLIQPVITQSFVPGSIPATTQSFVSGSIPAITVTNFNPNPTPSGMSPTRLPTFVDPWGRTVECLPTGEYRIIQQPQAASYQSASQSTDPLQAQGITIDPSAGMATSMLSPRHRNVTSPVHHGPQTQDMHQTQETVLLPRGTQLPPRPVLGGPRPELFLRDDASIAATTELDSQTGNMFNTATERARQRQADHEAQLQAQQQQKQREQDEAVKRQHATQNRDLIKKLEQTVAESKAAREKEERELQKQDDLKAQRVQEEKKYLQQQRTGKPTASKDVAKVKQEYFETSMAGALTAAATDTTPIEISDKESTSEEERWQREQDIMYPPVSHDKIREKMARKAEARKLADAKKKRPPPLNLQTSQQSSLHQASQQASQQSSHHAESSLHQTSQQSSHRAGSSQSHNINYDDDNGGGNYSDDDQEFEGLSDRDHHHHEQHGDEQQHSDDDDSDPFGDLTTTTKTPKINPPPKKAKTPKTRTGASNTAPVTPGPRSGGGIPGETASQKRERRARLRDPNVPLEDAAPHYFLEPTRANLWSLAETGMPRLDAISKEDDPFAIEETPISETPMIVPRPDGEPDEVWDEISKETRWCTFLYHTNWFAGWTVKLAVPGIDPREPRFKKLRTYSLNVTKQCKQELLMRKLLPWFRSIIIDVPDLMNLDMTNEADQDQFQQFMEPWITYQFFTQNFAFIAPYIDYYATFQDKKGTAFFYLKTVVFNLGSMCLRILKSEAEMNQGVPREQWQKDKNLRGMYNQMFDDLGFYQEFEHIDKGDFVMKPLEVVVKKPKKVAQIGTSLIKHSITREKAPPKKPNTHPNAGRWQPAMLNAVNRTPSGSGGRHGAGPSAGPSAGPGAGSPYDTRSFSPFIEPSQASPTPHGRHGHGGNTAATGSVTLTQIQQMEQEIQRLRAQLESQSQSQMQSSSGLRHEVQQSGRPSKQKRQVSVNQGLSTSIEEDDDDDDSVIDPRYPRGRNKGKGKGKGRDSRGTKSSSTMQTSPPTRRLYQHGNRRVIHRNDNVADITTTPPRPRRSRMPTPSSTTMDFDSMHI